jgi:hypothetical protein
MIKPNQQNLYDFLKRAIRATYAGNGGKAESERQGFIELTYDEGDYA